MWRQMAKRVKSCRGRSQLTGLTLIPADFWGSLPLKEENLIREQFLLFLLFCNTPGLDLQGIFLSNMQDCHHRAGGMSGSWVYVMQRTKSIRGSWTVEHRAWLGASLLALCITISPALWPYVLKAAVRQISHDMPTSETASDTWCNQEGSAELCCKCEIHSSEGEQAKCKVRIKGESLIAQHIKFHKSKGHFIKWHLVQATAARVIQRTWFLNSQLRSLI